jgi:glycine/D-amino acid oxidase-like deaminating enzyme
VFDVAIVGNGIIGLSTALELARSGASCALIGRSEPGGGSGAAAGILAPSAGQRDAETRGFFRHSLDLFPAFLAPLRKFDPGLAIIEGLLEVVSPRETRAEPGDGSRHLSEADLRRIEPALKAPLGVMLHPRDGAVDSARLMTALRQAAVRHPRITLVPGDGAAGIDVERSPARVHVRDGGSISANAVVLAAGAWSPQIDGLPRAVPVSPVKGQIIALDGGDVIRRPVMSDHVYLVPRGNELVVGATSEDAGFDTTTTDEAVHSLYAAAIAICPSLADARVTRRWAGLRPATADLLPILGRDPDYASLIYACGHSRNGILLAPATAEAVRSICEDSPALHPAVTRLSIARFPGAERRVG